MRLNSQLGKSMSGTEDSDPDWEETTSPREKCVTKGVPDSSFKGVLPVQKFCEKWLKIFDPWLARCTDNPNKPFCRACQCCLDCNRCHLQRHERTSKHARNLKILIEKGEEAARQNYNMRQERNKYYQQRKKLNVLQATTDMIADSFKEEEGEEEHVEDDLSGEDSFDFVKAGDSGDQYENDHSPKQKTIIPTRNAIYNRNEAVASQRSNLKKERMKLFLQIQKDKNDLMNTFKELMGMSNGAHESPPKVKNHVDLFFESVSSSVKALSPKLIAEAKMRVSQLICELELRALTENSENGSNSVGNTVAQNTIVVSPSSGNSYVLHRTAPQNTVEGQPHHEEPIGTEYEGLN